MVTVTVVPPAPPVVPPPVEANPSAVFDQVRPDDVAVGAAPTRLNAHCMRAMSEQVSWTIGLSPAVEPSLSLMHRPLPTLTTRYLPDAADEAVNVHCWLVCVPRRSRTAAAARRTWSSRTGTSMHLPLLTLTSL